MKKVTAVCDQVASIITNMGYEFVGCEILGKTLRIYIDSEKGVTVQDCARVSYQVGAMLDVADPISGSYILEVSSPGLNRPLFEIAHYQKQIGSRVKIKLLAPIKQRRKLVGIIVRVEGNAIHLKVDAEEMVLPFADIEKANVIADIPLKG